MESLTGGIGGRVAPGRWATRPRDSRADMQSRSGIVMISGISSRTAADGGTSRFTRLGVLVAIVVVIAVSAAQLINYRFFGLRIKALDPGSDNGVLGTIGDIALAAAAVSAWILAARVRSARLVTAALAGLLTFLAADKVTRLHEQIPYWPAFYLPVLAGAFICLVVIARSPSARPQPGVNRGAGRAFLDRLIGAGLLLLTFSLFLHLFGERLLLELGVSNPNGLAYQTKAMVKHGTEVAGWFLIAFGLLRLLPDAGKLSSGSKIYPLPPSRSPAGQSGQEHCVEPAFRSPEGQN